MSYEDCAKHPGTEATNGCDKCAFEHLENRMLDLDNFLADYFGCDGERETTLLFLKALKARDFLVVDTEGQIELGRIGAADVG